MSWRRFARVPGDPSSPHPASGTNFAVSDDVLASALDDLDAGFTPVEILDRYPQYADELAPLLQTAYELRVTRWPVMSVGGRLAGRERMHATLAGQKRRKGSLLSPVWRQVGVAAALAVMAGAVFLASPLSPVEFSRRGHGATPTIGAPAVVVEPSATLGAASTALPVASATSAATKSPTRAPASAEPSETPERLVLAEELRFTTATATITSTPTRRPTRASTVTPAPTLTFVASATAAATATGSNSGAATPVPPSPTSIPPTNTPAPTFTPGKPSPTPTVRPTEPPEPTAAPTQPSATPTRTPRPPATPAPTASETPEPTETSEAPEPARTPKHTPRPTETPGPTRTPRIGSVIPGIPPLLFGQERPPVQVLQPDARDARRGPRLPVVPGRQP